MRGLLVAILAISVAVAAQEASGKGTFFDSVKFIQYLDENTALEEIRNGNLDVYYYRISSDSLEGNPDGLKIFDSAGGSYSILVNPAESEEFNPFSLRDVRFALNYLVDRKLIVNELMGGHGSPITSYYGPSDPEYLTVIEQLETFNFRYSPALADEIISQALVEKGAVREGGKWHVGGRPVEITVFIRSDDPVRKSIGEILGAELQRIGFAVKKDFGDLNKAFVVVYGSDPSELKWSLYTEGWARSAFVRYDSVGLGQMYSPWFSSMPGFNDPTYWNYKNDKIDEITQRIYTGDFESAEERSGLIQDAVVEGVGESVRVFVASRIDQYAANQEISGMVNGFGAGIPNRFTPINARGAGELVVGVKQIYQGAWNPVMGLTDSYSRHIWGIISDPGVFKHPFTGESLPVRAEWQAETAGPNGKLDVPQDAIVWNPEAQRWDGVGPGASATSRVTFDFEFGNWHNGEGMDMNDILHSLYFATEWGTQTDGNDRTFDAEFTPRAAQSIQTIVGARPVDGNTLEVYVNYWHFDEGEIAEWAEMWSPIPWEIYSAMERAVMDGKVSFSRSGATGKNINWLSLIIPNDAGIIREYLQEFESSGHVPAPLRGKESPEYFQDRYDSSARWIEEKGHAVISNGPFYLESYSPESRTITVGAFDDESYPFEAGRWAVFEEAEPPAITGVEMERSIQRGEAMEVIVETDNSDSVLYFLTDGRGRITATESLDAGETVRISIRAEDTARLGAGASSIKIFATSESVLRPDFYESGFVVTDAKTELPVGAFGGAESEKEPYRAGIAGKDWTGAELEKEPYWVWIIPALAATSIGVYLKRRLQVRNQ